MRGHPPCLTYLVCGTFQHISILTAFSDTQDREDNKWTAWFSSRRPHIALCENLCLFVAEPVEFGMQDSYTFGPSGRGTFRMRFAYHEIHYITITGLKTAPRPADVIGYRLTSLGVRTGAFACSSELISKMYNTTINNYRGLTTGGMTGAHTPHELLIVPTCSYSS